MADCDSGSISAKSRRVTKLKVFDDKALFVRLKPGVRDRIDALRGEVRIGDFARVLIEEALSERERGEAFMKAAAKLRAKAPRAKSAAVENESRGRVAPDVHVEVPTLQRKAFNPQPKTGKKK